jgi:hypothetical protein
VSNQYAYDRCCEGCRHASYTAPNGQQKYPGCDPLLGEPHACCMALRQYIPITKVDGRIVRYEAPNDCPTRAAMSQGSLL